MPFMMRRNHALQSSEKTSQCQPGAAHCILTWFDHGKVSIASRPVHLMSRLDLGSLHEACSACKLNHGRKHMKFNVISGAAMAAAALSLAVGSTALTTPASAAAKVMCYGVNACKGQGACKTANNACKGQAACKGQGWINASAEDCAKWGGKVL